MSTTAIIADDHPLILDGVALLLTQGGFDVTGRFAAGDDAREAMLRGQPDLAVLDIQMPGRTGLELLDEARRDGWPTRIILLTASLQPEPLVEAVRLRADGLILKHAASDMLLRCARAVMAGEQWIDREAMRQVLAAMTAANAADTPAPASLTPREREIAGLVALGRRNKEIASELSITEGTVKMYLHTIYEKLGVGSRTELALLARDMKIA